MSTEAPATSNPLAELVNALKKGTTSVNDYTLHFRTLVAASGWNKTALLGAYRQGLNPDIRTAIALYDDSIGLESFLQRTTRVSQCLAAYQPSVTTPQPTSVVACSPVIEPMQIDSTRLSRTERNRRLASGLCLYCGQPGHRLRTCPVGPPRPVDLRFLVLEDSTRSVILGCPWLQQHHPELSWGPCDVIAGVNIVTPTAWSTYPTHPLLLSSCPPYKLKVQIKPPFQRSQLSTWHSRTYSASKQPPFYHHTGHGIVPSTCCQGPKGRVYPLSIPEHQAMEEYITEALNQGFIQPSTSPAASSFFVGKKDGGLRPCIDYRQLNSQIKQPYPLPLVSAALEELRGAQFFTKLDLWNAYNLVRIRVGDEWKTAFVTPTGHYEYRVMPYGLSISPSVFQTFMNEVFREFLHRFVVVYIDNILIYSRNLAEDRQHVQQVLHKLREHSLYLKLEKCEFHRSSVQFLGYISAEGVQMDQGKVSAIQEWPQPLTVKELQRFLGFSNFYRCFIKDYSSITAPLTSLLRGKPKTLNWNPSAHEAFQQLKIFSTAPLLHHPDPELPFTVGVDASTTGVGAVLSQAVGEPPLLHPCAFYSRKLFYDVGNRELLAIKLALEEWRHWLEGSTHPFTIITDHKNLQYLHLVPRTFLLMLYHDNSPQINQSNPNPSYPPNLIVSPILWEMDNDIRNATLQKPAPQECPEGKIFVPQAQRLSLLGAAHQSPGSGHPGSQRTLSLLQSRYWWPRMRRDTIWYVQSCSVCAMSTSPRQLPTGKLVPLPIPQRPWSHIGVDFVTDLPAATLGGEPPSSDTPLVAPPTRSSSPEY
ncbi:hypothetical protein M9458_051675 [Cirrhinus mrigala]|uniref:Gypsy retrotransposon integrase-like protein 1 n=1 Tax=Cirrhinus mrigala TaxID=683832 RepID=A0ABD0MWZ3_CIRMR